jgi:hypothetical protein
LTSHTHTPTWMVLDAKEAEDGGILWACSRMMSPE